MSGLDQDFRILERVSSAVGDAPAPQTNPVDGGQGAQKKRWSIPGIYSGTRISTSFGEVPAHLIRVRDQLRTRDGDYVRVLRIDEYKLDADFLARRVTINDDASLVGLVGFILMGAHRPAPQLWCIHPVPRHG